MLHTIYHAYVTYCLPLPTLLPLTRYWLRPAPKSGILHRLLQVTLILTLTVASQRHPAQLYGRPRCLPSLRDANALTLTQLLNPNSTPSSTLILADYPNPYTGATPPSVFYVYVHVCLASLRLCLPSYSW